MPDHAGPLLDQIRRDAAAAAEARVASARQDAARLDTESTARLEHRRASAVEDRERSRVAALEAARAETSQRVSRETLSSRAAALDRVFAAALLQMQALAAHPRLGAVLGRALADALTYLPDGPVTVRCARDVAVAVRAAVAGVAGVGRDTITVREDDGVPLGAIVEAADGTIAVDATFVRRLARERPRLAITIARQMEATSR
jgi:vacuolar-type H+-ATPase subunit E/Vma4